MKIALDFAFRTSGGIIPYFKEMIRVLSEVDPENEYLLLVTKTGYSLIEKYLPAKNVECKIVPLVGTSMILRFLWEQFILPFVLCSRGIEVLYSANSRTLFLSMGFKRVVCLNNIGPFLGEFMRCIGFWSGAKHLLLGRLIIASLKFADATIFESYYIKELLEKKYGYKGKWYVNHHCRPAYNLNNYGPDRINSVRQEFRLEKDYFLYNTYIRPYKNIERTIKAFASIQEKLPRPIDFVVAGPTDSQNYLNKLLKLCSAHGVENSFRFIGEVEHEKLVPLTLGCLGYVFPSKFESWSGSLTEAVTYGAAIITSTGTAMPETCGDAAIYFEPEDTKGLADAMLRLVNDAELRRTLSEKSVRRAAHFRDVKEDILFNLDVFKELIANDKRGCCSEGL